MKKLILPLLALLCLSVKTFSQTGPCNVQAFSLEYIAVQESATNPGKYDLRINLTWDIEMNTGNKFTYFHIWQDNSYVSVDYSKTSKPPKAAELSTTLGTIAIQNPSVNPTIVGTYSPDASYTNLLGMGSTIHREPLTSTIERFTIKNLLIPNVTYKADGSYGFIADLWSSQSGNNIHCTAKGNAFVVNEVANRSFLSCEGGNQIRVGLASTQPGSAGTFQVLVETPAPGSTGTVSNVAITTAQSYKTNGTGTLASDYPYSYFGPVITIPKEYNGKPVVLLVTPTGKSSQVFKMSSACAALPVTFGSFSATRKGQSVFVKWETLMELNVAGFNVQRMTNGSWTNIAFVPAKNVANGSSYELTDINAYKGMSQYRIVSIDIDGKQKISEIRSVRGEESSTKLSLYPNPSTTGRVNLVFDNSASRDISVIDMSGRVVKQLQNEKGSNVVLELMQDGLYQIQVTDRATGERMVEKVIIKKR